MTPPLLDRNVVMNSRNGSTSRAPTKSWSIQKNGSFSSGNAADDSLKKPRGSRRPLQLPDGPKPGDYDTWDFGKKHKNFTAPKSTAQNNKAATTLQRFVRGWWARVNFTLNLMNYKIHNGSEILEKEIQKMEKGMDKIKEEERKKLEEEHEMELKQGESDEKVVLEGKELIAYLRKENKKLRDKNSKIMGACVNLKAQNERLEGANTETGGNMDVLESHAKQIQETHDKLAVVVPKYEESVKQLTDAVEQHRAYCLAEHTIKLMYVKLIGTVVDMMEERCDQAELTDEIVGSVLAMEGKDNEEPLPGELGKGEGKKSEKKAAAAAAGGSSDKDDDDDSDSSSGSDSSDSSDDSDSDTSDSEDYDEYSVATFDQ